MIEIQKASVWKRVSAGLFDLIMLAIVGILSVLLLTVIFDYDGKLAEYNAIRTSIEEEYEVNIPVKKSEYQTYDEEKQARYDAAIATLNANGEAVRLYSLLESLILLEVTFGTLLAFLILEFMVPLLFKNGQTLGKKIFGISVIRNDTVKISGPVLFARTVLGKYAVETMLPAFAVTMILTGNGSIIFLIIAILVPLVNLVLFFVTKNHTVLHDLMALTVTADMATQRIFESKEALVEYQKIKAEEEANASRDEAYYFRR